MKPKEFWIIGSEAYRVEQLEEPLAFPSQQIHVVEKSAYDQALKDMKSIAKALEYYDNVHRLHWTINFNDWQEVAEVAIKALNAYHEKYGDKK